MALRVGDDDLLSRLMVGDLGANSTFYHKECYSNLYNIYTRVCKESEKAGIDIEQYKDAAYDKVIAYIYETQKGTPSSGFTKCRRKHPRLDLRNAEGYTLVWIYEMQKETPSSGFTKCRRKHPRLDLYYRI